jgi:hypothetical protein
MKNFKLLYILVLILLISLPSISQEQSSFQYVSPKPNSIMVSNETNIILRNATKLQKSSVVRSLISVVGSESGTHTGDFILTDDDQTIVFNPHKPFAYNEVVTVSVQRGIQSLTNSEVPGYSFSFTTETEGIVQRYDEVFDEDINVMQNLSNNLGGDNVLADTLPAPTITIDSLNNPGPGYIFMATWDRNVPQQYGNFIFILDSVGHIVDSVRVDGAPFDFQVQPNGLLTHALGNFAGSAPVPGEELQHIVRDSTLAVVDSFKMKNGYTAGFHEFLMLPNGHVMMYSFHTIIYDMSTIVPGGQTNCSLVINILQEQDTDRNVVFEWRNIDYIPITDSDLDLTASRVNYGTLNAFDIDDDGNILASFRNQSEIMKISRATGEVMWRMGSPRGEFTFVGEHEENAPNYFSRQHNIVRLPNGNISLFDNGQFHMPPYSRGVEYSLDEVSKVATLVSEQRYPNGNIFTATAGNAQRFPNGGWFIGYGRPHPQLSPVKRNAVEYHSDGTIALELSLPNGILAYRAYKFPWKELIERPSFTHFEVLPGNTYVFNDTTNSIFTDVTIKYIDVNFGYNEVTVTRLPFAPVQPEFNEDVTTAYSVSIIYGGFGISSHTSEIHINLLKYPEIKHPEKTSFFIRETPDQGVFTMLPTIYNSTSNELIATTSSFGEIVFGETDDVYTANVPIPYEPSNNQKVLPLDSLALRWTGQGFYDLFQLQVSTDSTFSTPVIDTTMNPSFFFMKNLINNTTYYWRVRSILGTEMSTWSSVESFEVIDAFVTMNTPNGGEAWPMGSENIIRWETNITDSVRLDLLYGQQIARVIDTTFGNPSAYRWLIPIDLTIDSTYKIIITSIKNSSITDTSDASFSIEEVIPVELTSFTAVNNNDQVILNWSTATEINNQGFEVERKTGDREYQRIGFVTGHGTTTEIQNYSYVDSKIASGIHTYRLKQIDFDGSFEYSSEVDVDVTIPIEFALEQNYPNPFNPSTVINFSIPQNKFVNINIYSTLGEKVYSLVNEEFEAGTHSVEFINENLSSGIYFYKMVAGNFSETKKLVLLK